ncbi:type II and III secretion system protein family protein [Thauera humireducens]|uniref:type II and III secretion system protein family protein n=1 Tax=Thauera humireducens TaxID=1134435 RepID=UPI00311EB974
MTPAVALADDPVELTMFEGETRVIPEPNAGRLAVGNGQVLSAAVLDDREILLIANKVGISSLHVWSSKGRNRRVKITVVPADTPRVNREIAAFIAGIPNRAFLGHRRQGGRRRRRPQQPRPGPYRGVGQALSADHQLHQPGGMGKDDCHGRTDRRVPDQHAEEIGLAWNATGGAAIGGIWMPGRRGNAPLQIDVRTGTENAPPIVNPDDASGPVPLSSSLNVLSAINAGLNAQLRLMEQNGSASILAQPVLSARNGAEASFLAGGEFPYSVSNINGTTIQFKPYGIRLEITPTVDHSGVIRARIMSEVSDLDLSVMGSSGPALRTRKTETEFNVLQGGTIVLSGLLSRDINASIDKVPFLGDIPVLGALFRSRRFQNNETELVVFVTPHAVDRHTVEQAETMLRARQRLDGTPRATEPDLSAMPGLPAAANAPDAGTTDSALDQPYPWVNN